MAANTILIVENDGILCTNMAEMLASQGYRVLDVLPSGEAALELVNKEQPDLIIMDIMLAGELDGISTAQQLKKIADLPLIYMTAYADDTLIRRARETAPHAYLIKPVQERELIATIEMALHRHNLEEKLKATETKLRKSEHALKEAYLQLEHEKDELTTLLEEMLGTVAVWVSIMDEAGNVTFWNKAAAAISGYTEEEVAGNKQLWEWLFPDYEYRNEVDAQVRTIIKERGKVEHFETKIQTKDGRQRTILWYANTLFMKGKQIGTLVLGTDITLHKQAEEALLSSEESYRLLVNNANEGIIVVQETEIKFANPMALKTFDCTAARLKATPFSQFVHPDDGYIFLERHSQRKKGKKVENPYTFRLVDAGGDLKIISMNSVAIEWDGAPAFLVMMTDITALKKMEEENIKKEKLDSIGILAGGIAHDFNNYLAILMGNISLARLYLDQPQKMVEKLDNLERATMTAQQLSNQLFAFAKGSEPLKKKVSLEQIVTHNVNFALSGSKVRPHFAIAADLYPVEADEGQFSQVLSNIVINAVQAMPSGGKIEVTAQNILPEGQSNLTHLPPLEKGNYVLISIKDEGIGIPEKHLGKIFDPYFTTKQKGSGLGLATSYTIMKNHGGHLGVASQPGEGTTFFLVFPAAAAVDAKERETSKIYHGAGRILLMDDQAAYRQAMGENLAALGYEVTTAGHGREAVELYTQGLQNGRPFDLVILDLTVPGGMGGKQAIKKLLKKDPQVKAIVASGYSKDPVLANHVAYGFKGAIKKPFTLEELSEIVHFGIQ